MCFLVDPTWILDKPKRPGKWVLFVQTCVRAGWDADGRHGLGDMGQSLCETTIGLDASGKACARVSSTGYVVYKRASWGSAWAARPHATWPGWVMCSLGIRPGRAQLLATVQFFLKKLN